MDLDLVDTFEAVLDRVLGSDDLGCRFVDLVECRVKRGCLTAAGRSGDEHHAGRAPNDAVETLQDMLRHPQRVERHQVGTLVQQAHHDSFAVLHRQGGHANVEGRVRNLYREATILWQALLGNIEAAHQLQPGDQRAADAASLDDLLLQYAVNTLSHAQGFLVGFDMDIGGLDLYGIAEHRAQQFQNRRFFRVVVGRQLLEIDPVLAEFFFNLGRQGLDLVGAAVDDVNRAQQLGFVDERELDLLVELHAKFVVGEQVGGIRHADEQAVAVIL